MRGENSKIMIIRNKGINQMEKETTEKHSQYTHLNDGCAFSSYNFGLQFVHRLEINLVCFSFHFFSFLCFRLIRCTKHFQCIR